MKIAASVSDPGLIREAVAHGADLIEIRLDLMGGVPHERLVSSLKGVDIPVLLTLRSTDEGGRFGGDAETWWETMEPLLPVAAMVDIEQPFARYAPRVREMGKTVVASFHTSQMPGPGELDAIGNALRTYGHIPKIVPKPRDTRDLISLLSFTEHSPKPVITSVMGEEFRFARIIMAFFGSEIIFSYVGMPASPGQYHVREARSLLEGLM
ncbi:MAG TPA: type I 3-dehydroquinate dehydratase [Methanoregulaceae archaeon]|nr:type I 3-dehydroquinate dehydratase [Methanoregulaceae archaeon]